MGERVKASRVTVASTTRASGWVSMGRSRTPAAEKARLAAMAATAHTHAAKRRSCLAGLQRQRGQAARMPSSTAGRVVKRMGAGQQTLRHLSTGE